jgi:hypothetical protein
MNRPKLFTLLLIAAFVLMGLPAWADSTRLGDFSPQEKVKAEDPSPGSAASFDKRLPPTLPGEEIETGGGKIKVWSSSGAVSSGDAPEPGERARHEREQILNGGVGVIVDQRHDNGQRPPDSASR